MFAFAWCLGCFFPISEDERSDQEERMIEDLVNRALADEADIARGIRAGTRVRRIWDIAPGQEDQMSLSSSSLDKNDVD